MNMAQSLEQAIIDAEAAQLKADGHTYRQIAQIQGCSPSGAHARVERAIKAVPVDAVESLRAVELERLDEMYRVALSQLRTDAVRVDHGRIVRDDDGNPLIDHGAKLIALDRLLKIQDRRAKLLGLDAPSRSRIEVITEDAVDAEIRRLEAEVAALDASGDSSTARET
jgi:hypothetical protein